MPMRTAPSVSRILASSLLASLLATLGCTAALPPLTPPEAGGAPWREMVSKHVVLRTDRSDDDAREALVELEHAYVALREIGFPQVKIDGSRIVVVHFDRERDYLQTGPAGTAGVFSWKLPNDLSPEPTMVVWGTLDAQARSTLLHEVTHMFVRSSLAEVPTWFNEGLAQYYETLSVEEGSAIVGRPIRDKRAWARSEWTTERSGPFIQTKIPVGSVPSIDELVAMDASTFYVPGKDPNNPTLDELKKRSTNYVGAWGLVHLLMHDPAYQPRLDAWMEQMSGGVPPRRAWTAAVAGVDGEAFETAYRQHMLNKFETMVLKTPYAHPEVTAEISRTMEPAEVHVLWARLRPWSGPHLEMARADLETAVTLAPHSAEPNFWGGLLRARSGDFAGAERSIEAALAASPDSGRYLQGLALVRSQRAEGKAPGSEDVKRADDTMARLAKVASSGSELNTVASYQADRRRWDEALAFAQRAVKADPTCSQCFSTLALALFTNLKFGDAVAAQLMAISLLPDGMPATKHEAKLREYAEAARTHGADPSPAPAPASAPATSSGSP